MTFFFSASPFAVWNYVNKARTSGCLYTPASGKKRRVETEVEREDMHGITNSNTARRLPNYICICCCLLHIRLVIKVDAPKKRMIFFPLVVVVVHLDYIFMSGGAGGQREAHTARKKEEERTHRASVSFEGQMEKICLNWNNNEN